MGYLCDYGRWNFIALVCAKLHNVCIDFGVGDASGMPEDYAKGDSAEIKKYIGTSSAVKRKYENTKNTSVEKSYFMIFQQSVFRRDTKQTKQNEQKRSKTLETRGQ